MAEVEGDPSCCFTTPLVVHWGSWARERERAKAVCTSDFQCQCLARQAAVLEELTRPRRRLMQSPQTGFYVGKNTE